jgi:signal transduction histidine kinase
MRWWTAAPAWVRGHREILVDLLVALVTTLVEISLVVDGSPGVGGTAVTLTVLAGAVLFLRRRAPFPVLAATVAGAAVLVVHHDYPGGAPVLVALAAVAETQERRISLVTLVPVAIFLQVGAISSPPVTIGAWVVGAYVQARHRYLAGLRERADHLEREREQLDQIAVQRERAAIARELHDVVAHSVTVMLLGVRGARDCLRTSPGTAEDTLRRVEAGAEQSIEELRRILLVLRRDDETDPSAPYSSAPYSPAPDLAALDELVEGYRAAGLVVDLALEGERRPLPAGVELSIHRIVQEALTNVLKHSRPTRTTVRVRFGAATVEVRIEDDGEPVRSGAPATGGQGVLGLRERVAALGGQIEIGPRPRGFRVLARLPIPVPEAR